MIKKICDVDYTTIYDISVGEHTASGIETNIPDTELYILQVRCTHGMLFCGIFAPEVIEKIQFPAAVFSAPRFEDMLERKPVYLSKSAIEMGATAEMSGEELISLFSAE